MRELCPAGALVSGLTQCSLAENSALRCSFCPEDLTFSHCRSVIKIEKKSFIHSSAPESMPVFQYPQVLCLGGSTFRILRSIASRIQKSDSCKKLYNSMQNNRAAWFYAEPCRAEKTCARRQEKHAQDRALVRRGVFSFAPTFVPVPAFKTLLLLLLLLLLL